MYAVVLDCTILLTYLPLFGNSGTNWFGGRSCVLASPLCTIIKCRGVDMALQQEHGGTSMSYPVACSSSQYSWIGLWSIYIIKSLITYTFK